MDEYEEILSRKLNPRDQAKVILDYTKTEIRRDRDRNTRTYQKLDHLDVHLGSGSGTALPDDEFNDVISGLAAKLDFSMKILLDRIMSTCNEMLLTACSEQGELMSFVIQELKNSLMIFSSTIKSLHTIILAILNEKNIFAGKALSLAKAPTVSYYTLLSDICLRNFVSIPLVLEKMFLNHGGTVSCNRYSSKAEMTSNQIDQSTPSPNPNPESEPTSVTSVNDMVEYLDTTYTSKIMMQFVADVKVTVNSILSEMKAKVEIQEASRRTAEKLSKLAVVPVSHSAKSRHMVLSVENESEALVQQMVFRRRNDAAFVIQCCRHRYKRRVRIQERTRAASAYSISRFLRASHLKMIIFRRMLITFSLKRARRMIRRNCLAYFRRVKRWKWAARVITKNLKKLWRNRSCSAIATLVKDLSRSIVQATWATNWGDLEKRLLRSSPPSLSPSLFSDSRCCCRCCCGRVESFLELCAPITIAQHALTRSKTLTQTSEDSPPEPDLFHKRLLTMAQWEWYESETGYELLMEEHQHLFSHMWSASPSLTSLSLPHRHAPSPFVSLPPESLEGFGTSDLVQSSLESLEERCSVYSIVASSVLRYGTLPMTSAVEQKTTRKVTKVKPSGSKTRAQTVTTMNVNRKSRDSTASTSATTSGRLPRFSQKPVFRASPPEELKPSQLYLRRTLVSPHPSESQTSATKSAYDHLRSTNTLTLEESCEEKSMSSLALSESGDEKDDDQQQQQQQQQLQQLQQEPRRRTTASRPRSKTKKFRSTLVSREGSRSPLAIPIPAPAQQSRHHRSTLGPSPGSGSGSSSTQSLTTQPPPSPSAGVAAAVSVLPVSVTMSHREQLTNLMMKFRGLEDG